MKSGSLNTDTGALSEQKRLQLKEEAQGMIFPLLLLLQVSLLSGRDYLNPKGASLLFAAKGFILWVCKGFPGHNGMGQDQKQ